MTSDKRTETMRLESGMVGYHTSDKLTNFLYLLMRNELSCGAVETIVKEVLEDSDKDDTIVFTNGWLAKYAHNISEMLKD